MQYKNLHTIVTFLCLSFCVTAYSSNELVLPQTLWPPAPTVTVDNSPNVCAHYCDSHYSYEYTTNTFPQCLPADKASFDNRTLAQCSAAENDNNGPRSINAQKPTNQKPQDKPNETDNTPFNNQAFEQFLQNNETANNNGIKTILTNWEQLLQLHSIIPQPIAFTGQKILENIPNPYALLVDALTETGIMRALNAIPIASIQECVKIVNQLKEAHPICGSIPRDVARPFALVPKTQLGLKVDRAGREFDFYEIASMVERSIVKLIPIVVLYKFASDQNYNQHATAVLAFIYIAEAGGRIIFATGREEGHMEKIIINTLAQTAISLTLGTYMNTPQTLLNKMVNSPTATRRAIMKITFDEQPPSFVKACGNFVTDAATTLVKSFILVPLTRGIAEGASHYLTAPQTLLLTGPILQNKFSPLLNKLGTTQHVLYAAVLIGTSSDSQKSWCNLGLKTAKLGAIIGGSTLIPGGAGYLIAYQVVVYPTSNWFDNMIDDFC